ncbi:MAG: O-antigen ligase family protein [Candidatus Thiodiazotropha taylori]|nr:O-antigen ligase family protein [Candidatus Thiodiazotropha taylori]MCW4305249.1 O-antigen ligase family protein [Candidatus Thiodiazotropha taylori]
MLLYIFLFLIAADYAGLGTFVPAFKALPFTLIISILLFLYVVSKNKVLELFQYKTVVYTSIFVLLTAFAGVHGLIKNYAIEPLKVQIGYLIFMFICIYLVTNLKQFRLFTLVFTLVHAALVVLNIDKVGGERVGFYIGGFFLGDGNDFAWSQNVAFPLAIHLAFTTKNTLFKYGYVALALIIVIGIVGTQSRGASLALAAGMLYYLSFISNKRVAGFILIGIIGIGVIALSPTSYFARMGTIVDYEEDSSAMGRLKAWRTATEMAIDNPILGVGAGSFNSAYGRFYKKPDDPARWISTHSVYFKVLAEYGFPGIIIYILSILHNLKINRETQRLISENQHRLEITPFWPQALNWATISWAICAMFLTGYVYPHLFLLMGLTIAVHRIVVKELEKSAEPVEETPAPARPRYF